MPTRAGKRSRMSSASSGYCSSYSRSGGRSPWRYRAANSSARRLSRTSRAPLVSVMSWLLGPARHGGKDFLQPPQGPDIALGGGLFFDVEHLSRLGAGQLLEVT